MAHTFRIRSSVLLVLLASCLELAKCLLSVVALLTLVYGLLCHGIPLVRAGFAMLLACVALEVGRWWVGSSVCCPLCRVSILGNSKCSKHRHARTLLGSHRLRLAVSAVFTRRFVCPYCNERTDLKIRKPHSRRTSGARRL